MNQNRKGLKLIAELNIDTQFLNKLGTSFFNSSEKNTEVEKEFTSVIEDVKKSLSEVELLLNNAKDDDNRETINKEAAGSTR